MTDKGTVSTSKFLGLILRHEPERVGLQLGEAGWVGADELLDAVNRHGKQVFERIELNGLPQTLRPVHCIQNTNRAELAAALHRDRISVMRSADILRRN